MINSVDAADRKSQTRGIAFLFLAAAIVAATIMTGDAVDDRPARFLPWLAAAGLAGINLTPLISRFAGAPLATLLDDETTRAHRVRSLAAGFWASQLSATTAALLSQATPVSAVMVAKIAISAGLATALVTFAVQELRAGS